MIKDDLGRMIQIIFKINEISFRIVNVYVPNEDDPSFFAKIFESLQDVTKDHVMIMGDMNKYLDSKLDKKGGTHRPTKSAEVIKMF